MIIPDVPYEEIAVPLGILSKHGIEVPLLISPTTPPSRAAEIAKHATGFLYIVSRLGVTGARSGPDASGVIRQIAELRAVTQLPLVAGHFETAKAKMAAAQGVSNTIIQSDRVDETAGHLAYPETPYGL